MRAIFLIIAFACAPLPVFAGTLAQEMSAAARSAKSLYAEFTQERTLVFMDEKIVSSGRMASDESGKIRWEINSPFKSVIIFDGKDAHQFEFSGGAWSAVRSASSQGMGRIMQEIRALAVGEYESRSDMYEFSESGNSLLLTPKISGMKRFISKIVIEADPKSRLPLSISLTDAEGDETKIAFTKFLPNPKELAGAFDVSAPQNFVPPNE